jgi:hypothetical protein
MSAFTDAELGYLTERRPERLGGLHRSLAPRGIEVRGHVEAIEGERPRIRIHPERIISWGLESELLGKRHSRAVG